MPWQLHGNEASRRIQIVLTRIVDHSHVAFVGGGSVWQLSIELPKLEVFATPVANAE